MLKGDTYTVLLIDHVTDHMIVFVTVLLLYFPLSQGHTFYDNNLLPFWDLEECEHTLLKQRHDDLIVLATELVLQINLRNRQINIYHKPDNKICYILKAIYVDNLVTSFC